MIDGYYWFSGIGRPEKRREFFDNFAKSKNFNPLDVENWYTMAKKDVVKAVRLFLFKLHAIVIFTRHFLGRQRSIGIL
jgi:hypothetical protein